ncbi:MbtH family protein [Streptomyces sp. G45]|uniref:MbtH family protein n=1 Tax=Streptomyces sp. G45 TaxID=3406627 RepID=UPI003C1AC6A6
MRHRVVVNHEEQYSIWPVDQELPPGWTDTGFTGPREDCLAHISEVWTDITPLSVRQSLGG